MRGRPLSGLQTPSTTTPISHEHTRSHHGWPGRSHSTLRPKHGCVTINITPRTQNDAQMEGEVRVHQVHTAVSRLAEVLSRSLTFCPNAPHTHTARVCCSPLAQCKYGVDPRSARFVLAVGRTTQPAQIAVHVGWDSRAYDVPVPEK